ncbi:hypothetical protein AN191_10475 [Loktanella sp. 5RATIMAR09]|uniref:hypothetical protein n=1 Tax=Loktanella sp. 5RATIMAR09 TaxID=1225655 RepID=UPI0006EBC8BE|nr:hypothetical protein [Loktanella sp. 5RATIMAR09]KQI71869.1 hypothetical protein AN191_10475 [Loktanella sp. 5RATIMAR09]
MKFPTLFGLAALALSACAPEPAPLPSIPEGVATRDFTFVDESFLRGVRGSSNTTPRGRPAAILEVTYGLRCVADGAQSSRDKAQQALDDAFLVAPLFFNTPRERGAWNRNAARALDGTGCILNGFSYETKTTDIFETGLWAIRNQVPPAR